MKTHRNSSKILGTVMYSIGIILSFTLLSMMVWGDLEASLFSSSLDADQSLKTLRCPVFISPEETGVITARFRNPTEDDWERYTRSFISEGFVSLMREIKMTVQVPANGVETAVWNVYPEDAAYKRIVLFRTYVNAKYPYPSLGGSCGIIVLDIAGLTGQQIFSILVIASLAFVMPGILIWNRAIKKGDRGMAGQQNARMTLTAILFAGIVIGYLGNWVVALLLLAVGLLMIGIIIGRRMSPAL